MIQVDPESGLGSSGGVNRLHAALVGARTARYQAVGLWRLHGPSNELAPPSALFSECANSPLVYQAENGADKEIICLKYTAAEQEHALALLAYAVRDERTDAYVSVVLSRAQMLESHNATLVVRPEWWALPYQGPQRGGAFIPPIRHPLAHLGHRQ
jgi:hypothetical protein